MLGNSSAGIRETGVYGIPGIDVGTRQSGRYSTTVLKNLQHVDEDVAQILGALGRIDMYRWSCSNFGDGNSTERFNRILSDPKFWKTEIQKHFIDYDI